MGFLSQCFPDTLSFDVRSRLLIDNFAMNLSDIGVLFPLLWSCR